MNGKELLLAFAEISDEQIMQANNIIAVRRDFQKHRALTIRVSAAICCLLATVLFAAMISLHGGSNNTHIIAPAEPGNTASTGQSCPATPSDAEPASDHDGTGTSTSETAETDNSDTEQNPDNTTTTAAIPEEFYPVPHWEDKEVYEKYIALYFQGIEYRRGRNAVSPDYLGGEIGRASSTGYDVYTDTVHTIELPIFSLNGINTECAIGVRFDDGNCFAFLNFEYVPATMSQFIDDLNLRATAMFGQAYYNYFDNEKRYHTVTFEDFDDGIIWERLLSETSLTTTAAYTGRELIDISVSVPELGYNNQALWVTEEGYIVTNILDSAKAFYIGPENAKAFVDYMFDNLPHTDSVNIGGDDTEPIPE